MAGPPDNRGLDHRFDRPPDERTKRVDVIGNAKTLIPAVRRLMAAHYDLNTVHTARNEHEATAKAAFIETARSGIVLPLLGHLPKSEVGEEERVDGQTITGREISGKGRLWEGTRDTSLSGSAVLGYEIIMKCAQGPKVLDSVIVGRTVFYSSNNNNDHFAPEQLELMTRLAGGIRERNGGLVRDCLSDLEEHIDPVDLSLYKPRGENEQGYERFGGLQNVAATVDKLLLPFLTGDETTNIIVDNSVIFANSVMPRVLGGTIRNSIIASNHVPLVGAHVNLKNVIVVSDLGDMYFKEGSYGNSEKALEAVAAVKNLPLSPLLSM